MQGLSGCGRFPFLFGGTFIEGATIRTCAPGVGNFPSFSEGLSLRDRPQFVPGSYPRDFPSFSEGLSLRVAVFYPVLPAGYPISLPFRRDFH